MSKEIILTEGINGEESVWIGENAAGNSVLMFIGDVEVIIPKKQVIKYLLRGLTDAGYSEDD